MSECIHAKRIIFNLTPGHSIKTIRTIQDRKVLCSIFFYFMIRAPTFGLSLDEMLLCCRERDLSRTGELSKIGERVSPRSPDFAPERLYPSRSLRSVCGE